MTLRVLHFLAVGLMAVGPAWAQGGVKFEVASIKPVGEITPDQIVDRIVEGKQPSAGRVQGQWSEDRISLRELILLAYGLKPYQLQGPDWLGHRAFEVAATLPEGSSRAQLPAMMQVLLTERFHLKIRRESRDQNVYALVQAKDGHKMKTAATDAEAGEMKVVPGQGGNLRMEVARMTMGEFVMQLAQMTDRPVVDGTGLAGAYQVGVEFSGEDIMAMARAAGVAVSDVSVSQTIFKSLERLGLRLEGQKGRVEVVVVENVDRDPGEN